MFRFNNLSYEHASNRALRCALIRYPRSMDARYPIGKFSFPQSVSAADRQQWIGDIAATPGRLRAAMAGLNPNQLDTPYRDGGWTVRQVLHHVPESHMNAYIRFKLALTENEPTI